MAQPADTASNHSNVKYCFPSGSGNLSPVGEFGKCTHSHVKSGRHDCKGSSESIAGENPTFLVSCRTPKVPGRSERKSC